MAIELIGGIVIVVALFIVWFIFGAAATDARKGMDPGLRKVIDDDKKLTEWAAQQKAPPTA